MAGFSDSVAAEDIRMSLQVTVTDNVTALKVEAAIETGSLFQTVRSFTSAGANSERTLLLQERSQAFEMGFSKSPWSGSAPPATKPTQKCKPIRSRARTR